MASWSSPVSNNASASASSVSASGVPRYPSSYEIRDSMPASAIPRSPMSDVAPLLVPSMALFFLIGTLISRAAENAREPYCCLIPETAARDP